MRQPLICFGGTFNPVHVGHLIIARAVAEQLGAKRVSLIPSAIPPHKACPGVRADDRLEMLHLAVQGDELFEVNRTELERPGPSYTVDTLKSLRRLHGPDVELVWVIGLDSLVELGTWRQASEVVELARVVTAVRPPVPADLDDRLALMANAFTPQQLLRLRADILPTPLLDISATQIRARVRERRSIRYLVPDRVDEYIARHGLYRL
jgi:nicotinate-nucleotide adenylyltransferase